MTSRDADPFAEIRPYTDSEAPQVLSRLANNGELADALAKLKLRRLYRWLPSVAQWLTARWLRQTLTGVTTIDGFQQLIKPQLEAQLAASARFSCDGLDKLSADGSWLFISNHRDIAMDPALTNYAIHQAGHRTLSIAIGDNLLRKDWVADLMRLNKSFIVRRNITAPRELMAASKQLSSFMRWMVTENRGPVWIAQREGRAKDGVDATEPAVIKMLALSRDRKTESVAEVLSSLNIVPVAIAYELDPCDAAKAAELAQGPNYTKSEGEDVRSIGMGISGQKGCVHLSFGQPLSGEGLEVDAVVAAIDRQIVEHYRLFETNLWAWQRLEHRDDVPPVTVYPGSVSRAEFDARIDAMPDAHRPHALAMYANPVRRALELADGNA